MGRFVVVAEPHDYLRRMLGAYLASQGFRTAEAATLAAARELIARDAPAVLLVDLALPAEDLVASVRAARLATRILVTAGASQSSPGALARDLGVHAVIEKPFLPSTLVDLVRLHAGARSATVDRKMVTLDGITYDVRPMAGVLHAFELWCGDDELGFFVLDDDGRLDERRSSAHELTAAELGALVELL